MNYKLLNKIVGWVVFAIAAVTYCMTIEPTASFWDCPEFITTGFKLEVGHPPGAPIFMLTANLFSQFVSDPTQVAMMVNIMSAILSALCILFLFWSITYLAKKLVAGKNNPDLWQTITIIGAGLVGALAYTWSDTFWFSAVEGEVYAYSSFCTAVTFWLILKWEESCDEPHSARWLVLIAYLIGISVGVHLLNLLCITAIVLVYYFKKTENPTLKGGILAFCLSGVLIAAVLYGIVPGIVKVGGWFELLFVNGMGLPFNTGLITYLILLVASIVWGVYESQKGTSKTRIYISFITTLALTGMPFYGHKAGGILFGIAVIIIAAFYLFYSGIAEKFKPSPRVLNTIMLCVMMITIGYSSYAVIVIRSTANPPMDQSSPEDVFSLGEYLAREQYGTRPLFYGQTYASQIAYDVNGNMCSAKLSHKGKSYGRKEKANENEKDIYYVKDDKIEYVYAQNMLFPRMYSADGKHITEYKRWCGGIKGKTVKYDNCGRKMELTIPTQMDNLKFFFRYQVNFMYVRYLLWNFVGRQNDIQSSGEIDHGNWITGINFIDKLIIGGDQRLLPDSMKGKGRNVFYGLPFLLGIIGLIWQFGKDKEGKNQFWIVFTLFFMTGLAIVVYLNQTPLQPRERDYAYAGSFYAFAIWIGLGVAALSEYLRKLLGKKASAVVAVLGCLIIPIQMVGQTWDDHDRSGRYTCRDFGQNYLKTLPKQGNPIIFTNGDNDTFPLWYNLETEGFRTDTRVCNLSYLQTDWYIDQMKRPAYDSPAVPISFERIDYETGTNEYIEIRPDLKPQIFELAKAQGFTNTDDLFELNYALDFWIKKKGVIPTDTLWLKLDKDAILKSGMMIPSEYIGSTDEETKAKMPDRMYISLKGKRALLKQEIMMLDMIAHTNWTRPLYIATTVASENFLNLGPYLVLEGLAYRFSPFNYQELGYSTNAEMGVAVDTQKMYDNLMSFNFGGLDNENVYLDETVRRMCYSHRRIFAQSAIALINEGEKDKALNLLNKLETEMSPKVLPHDFLCYSTEIAKAFIAVGEKEKALPILTSIATDYFKKMEWYLSMGNKQLAANAGEFQDIVERLYAFVLSQMEAAGMDKETFQETMIAFDNMFQQFKSRV